MKKGGFNVEDVKVDSLLCKCVYYRYDVAATNTRNSLESTLRDYWSGVEREM